jgi:hypothetical protein
MPILTRPEFGPRTALAYVTAGALIDVWSIVWYFTHEENRTTVTHFWVIGLVLTGLTLVTLGLLLGRLGQAARQAELPPAAALRAEAEIQKIAAANTNTANGQPVSTDPSVPMVAMPSQSAKPTYAS